MSSDIWFHVQESVATLTKVGKLLDCVECLYFETIYQNIITVLLLCPPLSQINHIHKIH